jgi:hypothetical protein
VDDEEVRVRVGQLPGQGGRRLQRVHEGDGGTGEQDPEVGDGEVQHVGQLDAHDPARAGAVRGEAGGQAQGPVAQLGEGERVLAVDEGDAVRVALGRGQQDLRRRGRDVVQVLRHARGGVAPSLTGVLVPCAVLCCARGRGRH